MIAPPHAETPDQPKQRRIPVTRRILEEVERAGNHTDRPEAPEGIPFPSARRPGPLLGLPKGLTYVELARAVHETPEPTAAEIKTVQRAAKRLVKAGRIERQCRRSDGVVVSRIPTDADREFRARLLREDEERRERIAAESAAAKRDATGYLDEAGIVRNRFDGGLRIEPVLKITADGVELGGKA